MAAPPPAQKLRPPFWVVAGSDASIRCAIRRGFNLILDQYASPQQIAARIDLYNCERYACGLGFHPMQVAVARQLYVATDEADKQAALERQAACTKRTVDVSPDRAGGSHALAYANRVGGTEESALYSTPDEIAAMFEAPQSVGAAYLLLTIAGSTRQLHRFAQEIMPDFVRAGSSAEAPR